MIASDGRWSTIIINHCTCREDCLGSRLDTCVSLIKATCVCVCVCVHVSKVIELEGKRIMSPTLSFPLRLTQFFLQGNKRKTPDLVCDHQFCYMLHAE